MPEVHAEGSVKGDLKTDKRYRKGGRDGAMRRELVSAHHEHAHYDDGEGVGELIFAGERKQYEPANTRTRATQVHSHARARTENKSPHNLKP